MAAPPPSAGLAQRVREPEIMDDPGLEPGEHQRALRALARINRLSGTVGRVWREMRRIGGDGAALRVLEVACGGGDVAVALARRAQRAGITLSLTATDLSERALDEGRTRAERAGVPVRFEVAEAPEGLPAGPWDLVYSSLFVHHLEPPAVERLFAHLARSARWIVMDDLRRTRRGLWLAELAARTLTRSPVVRADGPASVRAAFTIAEVTALARRSGLGCVRVRRSWPQRWTLIARGAAS